MTSSPPPPLLLHAPAVVLYIIYVEFHRCTTRKQQVRRLTLETLVEFLKALPENRKFPAVISLPGNKMSALRDVKSQMPLSQHWAKDLHFLAKKCLAPPIGLKKCVFCTF